MKTYGFTLDTAELAGDLTLKLSDETLFPPRRTIALVEQDLGPYGRRACWAEIPKSALEDGDLYIVTAAIDLAIDTHLRPWRRPDPSPFETFELFPLASRIRRELGRLWARIEAR